MTDADGASDAALSVPVGDPSPISNSAASSADGDAPAGGTVQVVPNDGEPLLLPPDAAAAALFGDELPLAMTLARLLAGAGVERGLIGPREVPILWDRHLVNCALLADLLPVGVRVVDVGSGAGLPGLVLAIRRPDLRLDLVEPMLRRTDFLQEAIELLGLMGRVRVVRGRAEERSVRQSVGEADWVTARAVAPLERLVRWCVPLLASSGTLLALKGERAADEVAAARAMIRSVGGEVRSVQRLGDDGSTTWVVRVVRTPGRGSKDGARSRRTAQGTR